MKPKGRLEKLVKNEIRNHLNKDYTYLEHACYIPGTPGWPDRIVCYPLRITHNFVGRRIGVFVGIESKRCCAMRTPIQRALTKKLRAAGGVVFRVSSWKQVERIRRYVEQQFH